MVKTLGLNHINLNVSDIDRSLQFYLAAFGLEERFREGPGLIFVGTPGARDLITLCQAEEGGAVGPTGGISHFGFAVADMTEFEKVVLQVQHAGGTLRNRGEHAPDTPFAYFSDPDGYIIELGVA